MKPHRRRLTKWPVIRQLRPLWYPIAVRLRSSSVAVTTLPGLVGQPGQRQLLSEIRTFERNLPDRLRRPLPEVMTELTAITAPTMPKPAEEITVRRLADLAILLNRRSPLGVCLRRSLTRYYFLRQIGLPVSIHFGARLTNGQTRPASQRQMTGHAWLTLNDRPYFEPSINWKGFTVMLTFPDDSFSRVRPDGR